MRATGVVLTPRQWSDEYLHLNTTALDGTVSLPELPAPVAVGSGAGERHSSRGLLARQRSRRERKRAETHGEEARAGSYEVALTAQPLQDSRFWRTKQFVAAARFVLVNRSAQHLLLVQDTMPHAPCSLRANEQAVWHWPRARAPHRLRLSTSADGWRWSGSFDPARLGETIVCLRATSDAHRRQFFTIYVQLAAGQTLVIVSPSDHRRPRFRVDNLLPKVSAAMPGAASLERALTVYAKQHGVDVAPLAIAPGKRKLFAWDEPCGERKLSVVLGGKYHVDDVCFDELDKTYHVGKSRVIIHFFIFSYFFVLVF